MTAPRPQTTTSPRKVSFVLHFSRSAGSTWQGRMQEVERGRSRPFLCLETFVEELALHGVALGHRRADDALCDTCRATLAPRPGSHRGEEF